MPSGVYIRTEETRRRMSESAKKKIWTEEHKKKFARWGMSGEKNPFYGRHHTELTKQKLREAMEGKVPTRLGAMLSDWHKKRIGEGARRARALEKSDPNFVHPMLGRRASEEAKRAMSEGQKGILHTEETKGKMRKARIRYLQKSQSLFISRPEKIVRDVIQLHGFPFRHTGDGKFWIAGKCPDFICTDKSKRTVIEVLGCYWHGCSQHFPKGGYRKVRDDSTVRIKHFDKWKFKCIIIWECTVDEGEDSILKILENFGFSKAA